MNKEDILLYIGSIAVIGISIYLLLKTVAAEKPSPTPTPTQPTYPTTPTEERIVLTTDNQNPKVNEQINIKAEFFNVKPGNDGYYYYKWVIDSNVEEGTEGIDTSVTQMTIKSIKFNDVGQHTIYIIGMDGCKSNELIINVTQPTCGVKFIVYNPCNRYLYLSTEKGYEILRSSGEVTLPISCDPHVLSIAEVHDKDYIVHNPKKWLTNVPYAYYEVYRKQIYGGKMYTVNIDYSQPPSGGYVNISVVNVPRDTAPYLAAYLEGVMFPQVGGTATSFNLNLHLEPGTWNISVRDTKSGEVLFTKNVNVVEGKTIYIKYDYNTKEISTPNVVGVINE